MKDMTKHEIKQFLLKARVELLDKVKQEADENYRSINGQICFILDQYFEKKQHEQS